MATTDTSTVSADQSLAELQGEARARGLATGGSKTELLQRIQAYDADQGLNSPEAPEQTLSADGQAQAAGNGGQETNLTEQQRADGADPDASAEEQEAEAEQQHVDLDPAEYVFSRLSADNNFDLYQRKGYVAAAFVYEDFNFGADAYDGGGVIVIPDDDSEAFVVSVEEFNADFVGVPPSKYIDTPPNRASHATVQPNSNDTSLSAAFPPPGWTLTRTEDAREIAGESAEDQVAAT